jgi:integrase
MWTGSDGFPLDYGRADALRGSIRTAIAKKTFNPQDYLEPTIKLQLFDNAVDKWLLLKEKTRRPSSVKDLKGHMKNYILPFFGGMNIQEIRKFNITDFLNSLPDTIKNKTKKNIVLTLHSFIRWAIDEEIRKDALPFPELTFEDDAKERVALDYADQQKYLEMIPEKYRNILEFGMETGVRPGELVALKVKDIDLKNGTAYIRRTISAYVNVIESTKGKSKKHIPLSDRAIEISIAAMENSLGESWLFINPDTGRRYSVKMPNILWKRFTSLDVVYYEASRHSFITQLIDEGHDAVQVMQLSRHSDPRILAQYYHGSKLRDLVNKRGRVIDIRTGDVPEQGANH